MPYLKTCPKCGSSEIEWHDYEECVSSPDGYSPEQNSELSDADIALGWYCKSCHTWFATEQMIKDTKDQLHRLAIEMDNRSVVPSDAKVPWDDEEA